jgi:hemoglobin
MRHAPLVIGPMEREAWLRHMLGALSELAAAGRLSAEDAAEMDAYFVMAATQLTNAP